MGVHTSECLFEQRTRPDDQLRVLIMKSLTGQAEREPSPCVETYWVVDVFGQSDKVKVSEQLSPISVSERAIATRLKEVVKDKKKTAGKCSFECDRCILRGSRLVCLSVRRCNALQASREHERCSIKWTRCIIERSIALWAPLLCRRQDGNTV